MKAYHGNPQVKRNVLARVRRHRAADEIIKGIYWEQGKGCAVGCTIHGDEHRKYERELGIPEVLAQVEDRLFESLPKRVAKDWPIQFLANIKAGANLEKVWPQLALYLLVQAPFALLKGQTPGSVEYDAVEKTARLYAAVALGVPVAAEDWTALYEEYSGTPARNFIQVTGQASDYDFRRSRAHLANYAIDNMDLSSRQIVAVSEKLLELLKAAE